MIFAIITITCITRFNSLLASTTSSVGHDGTVATSAQTGAGYGAFGRIQRVNGRTVGIFNTISLTDNTPLDSTDSDFSNNDQDYFDVVGATDLPVYVYTNSLLDDYETKALGGLKTYKSRQNNFDKSDDVIYIFRYDGETVFQYAIDIKGDNN